MDTLKGLGAYFIITLPMFSGCEPIKHTVVHTHVNSGGILRPARYLMEATEAIASVGRGHCLDVPTEMFQ